MASYDKFWRNCRYRKYVGLNSNDAEIVSSFNIMAAPVDGWRSELLTQIQSLPGDVTHVLLMLDDFLLLSPVNEVRLDYLVAQAADKNIDYLRLVPMTSALIFRILRQVKNRLLGREFETIAPDTPYYSSLQPTLWKREHLLAMLELPGSIWDFENQSLPGANHYAITHSPPIRCVHVVEKGEWMPDAALRFRRLALIFTPGIRQMRPPREIPLLWYRQAKFALIGYTGLRARRILGILTSGTHGKGRAK
jgi:hypothetical protein